MSEVGIAQSVGIVAPGESSVTVPVTSADIEAYIAAEVAKAVAAANAPAPVKVATPAERLRITADQLHASGGRDGQQIVAAIEAIVDYVLGGS